MADPQTQRQYLYSPAVTATTSGSFGLGSNLAWDAYVRDNYNRLNFALQRQANMLLKRGGVTEAEARALSAQRTLILKAARDPLSPFGRLYSEFLKPSSALPNFDSLLAQKGTIEAVVASVGKTRSVVNRLSVVMKTAGHGAVVLQIVVSVVLIVEAKPEDRARVAAGQVGAISGGALGGWGGAWAGCAGAGLLASPSLAIPIVGEVGTGGACLVGGLLGGLGFGVLGAFGGEKAGEAAYDYVTSIHWTRP